VNVILVPALLLLIGLAVYKKVIEPRRNGEGTPKPAKATKAPKPGKEPRPSKADKQAVKARAGAGSGRMGSVL